MAIDLKALIADGEMLRRSGADPAGAPVSAYALTLLDDTGAATARATLGAAPEPTVFNPVGLLSAQPAASVDNAGFLYFATDENGGTLYRSNGTSWVQAAAGVTELGPTSVFVPAAAFGLRSGTPALIHNFGTQHWSTWQFDPNTDESVTGQVALPSTWATLDMTLVWSVSASTSGDVRWIVQYQFVSAAGDLEAAGTNLIANATVPAQRVRADTVMGSDIAVAGDLVRLRVTRDADNAGDTNTTDASLLGIMLAKAS
jgi:hypothetical protein